MKESKACSKCKIVKPMTEFHNKTKSKDGKVSSCKICRQEFKRNWRRKNKDIINAKLRERYAKDVAKENKSPEQIAFVEKNASRAIRSRALRRASAERHGSIEWKFLLTLTGGKCAACGSTNDITKDHVIPVTLGGSDGLSNLQVLCRSCNSLKRCKTIDFRTKEIIEALTNFSIPCKWCGTPLLPPIDHRKYCSDKCRQDSSVKKNKEKRQVKRESEVIGAPRSSQHKVPWCGRPNGCGRVNGAAGNIIVHCSACFYPQQSSYGYKKLCPSCKHCSACGRPTKKNYLQLKEDVEKAVKEYEGIFND